MSIQFGRWSLDGQQPSAQYLESVSARLAQSGLDGKEEYSKGGLKILYLAFYTTEESRREKQPHIFPSGTVLTWDGRLDNRIELVKELRGSVTADATDLAIAAAAYETWGSASFGKLIGDWAMSIWDPRGPSLTLATDAIGMRRLYYSFERNHVTWSSILDPLVEFADRAFKICEEYVAGWFAYFPDAHLTPYQGVYAVPPASFVVLKPGKNALDQTVTRYWEFDSRKRIRYRTDAEREGRRGRECDPERLQQIVVHRQRRRGVRRVRVGDHDFETQLRRIMRNLTYDVAVDRLLTDELVRSGRTRQDDRSGSRRIR